MMTKLITERQLIDLTGLSRSWITTARAKGDGPKFLKLRGAIRYRLNDVEDWLQQSVVDRAGKID